MSLPFAMEEVREGFGTALVNALEPDNAATSALLARL
jgi:hypothetical protein